ncbi:NAD-dependent epimerase/dehydratase family protein [Streptomyces sp. NPDC020141]|uniref:NAD-dependent epimerase/dehydratase family protein n=1 Tax=Streptomyces sp. NPDC020141 TaxID=3365065 RepID=UPI003789AD29
MRLLVLGGTEFAGRAVAEAGLARGWEVTLFNRGRREGPRGTRALVGDRTRGEGLEALRGGEWDVVVDTWASAPRGVRDAARLLADRAGRYVYVSSCSVYAWPAAVGFDETAPLVDGSQDAEDVPYAESKRGGELAAVAAFGEERSLLVRAGLLLGPWENIDRLPWWLRRIARGGPVLAPGPRDNPLQYIDIRDLAEWTLSAAEAGLAGPYNMASEQGHTTMEALLTACVRATGSDAELRWTEPRVILEAGIEPWSQLPVWVPATEAADLHNSVYRLSVAKALAAGLRCRPVEETVADTWAWLRSADVSGLPRHVRATAGLAPELEAKVLGTGTRTAR